MCALDELLVTDTSDQEALDDFLNSSANDARGSTSSLTSGEPDLSLVLMFLLQCFPGDFPVCVCGMLHLRTVKRDAG